MSRLEHVVQVGAALKQTAPTPTAVFPIRKLPGDLSHKISMADLQNIPLEDLCGKLYERCLIVNGSGKCPPTDPIWEAACQRLGLTQQAGFGPMGDPASWQETFRTFCEELPRLAPYVRRMLWLCLQGRIDLISDEDRESASMDQELEDSIPPMVLSLLLHHGIEDLEPPADDYDDYAPGGWLHDRL